MTRSYRFWLVVGVAIATAAVVTYALLDGAASKTLAEPRQAREREIAKDVSGARGRPALLQPAAEGDARAFYRAIADERPALVTPGTADEAVERVLAAARQPLSLAAGESLASPGDGEASLSHWAGSFVGASLAHALARDPSRSLRCATAGLVVAWDGLAFAPLAEASRFDLVAQDALATARKALSMGVPDASSAAELAAVLDAVSERVHSRAAAWEFAVAEAQAAGASSDRDSWETPRNADPGAEWLWSESIARKDAVAKLREEACSVLGECGGPPERLRAACEAARARWATLENPYLCLVLHARYETVHWRPEPIVRTDEMLEARRSWHERLAVAKAAVAIARHAADRGTLPHALADLVPAYAKTEPVDPTSGKALRYEGGLVWAPGPDGDDDDGRPIDDGWSGHGIPDGDVVWRVSERRLAKPAEPSAAKPPEPR